MNVLEGRPMWEQEPSWAIMACGLPVVGLIGGAIGWRQCAGEARIRWSLLLLVQLAGFVLSLWVSRASATANALGVPGAAVLLLALLTRARAIGATLPRALATVGALLAGSPGQAAGIVVTVSDAFAPPARDLIPAGLRHHAACTDVGEMRAVAQLPAGSTIFAPIDTGPEIIATTGQRAIGGGYHRGAAPMARVLTAFTATPERAQALIAATGARYVAACPGLPETNLYQLVSPRGLWMRLERGERIAWLEPVPLRDTHMLAWRVVDPPQHPLPEAVRPL